MSLQPGQHPEVVRRQPEQRSESVVAVDPSAAAPVLPALEVPGLKELAGAAAGLVAKVSNTLEHSRNDQRPSASRSMEALMQRVRTVEVKSFTGLGDLPTDKIKLLACIGGWVNALRFEYRSLFPWHSIGAIIFSREEALMRFTMTKWTRLLPGTEQGAFKYADVAHNDRSTPIERAINDCTVLKLIKATPELLRKKALSPESNDDQACARWQIDEYDGQIEELNIDAVMDGEYDCSTGWTIGRVLFLVHQQAYQGYISDKRDILRWILGPALHGSALERLEEYRYVVETLWGMGQLADVEVGYFVEAVASVIKPLRSSDPELMAEIDALSREKRVRAIRGTGSGPYAEFLEYALAVEGTVRTCRPPTPSQPQKAKRAARKAEAKQVATVAANIKGFLTAAGVSVIEEPGQAAALGPRVPSYSTGDRPRAPATPLGGPQAPPRNVCRLFQGGSGCRWGATCRYEHQPRPQSCGNCGMSNDAPEGTEHKHRSRPECPFPGGARRLRGRVGLARRATARAHRRARRRAARARAKPASLSGPRAQSPRPRPQPNRSVRTISWSSPRRWLGSAPRAQPPS